MPRRAAQNARKSAVLSLCAALLITRRRFAVMLAKAHAKPAKAPFFRLLPARFGPYLRPPCFKAAAIHRPAFGFVYPLRFLHAMQNRPHRVAHGYAMCRRK
jgi:hypothetical protein